MKSRMSLAASAGPAHGGTAVVRPFAFPAGTSAGVVLRRLAGILREALSTALAALDGLLAGLVVGYVVAAMISTPGKHLGLPFLLDWAIVGLGATGVVLVGAAIGLAARRLLLLGGAAFDAVAARVAPPWRRSTRLRPALALPGRLLRGTPVAWLGAFAVALLVANVAPDFGPLALLLPAGALGPYVILGGAVAGLGAAAWHVAAPYTRPVARPLAMVLAVPWRQPGATTPAARIPSPPTRTRGLAAVVLAGAAVTLVGYGGLVMTGAGRSTAAVAPDPAFDGQGVATALADPGAAGPFAVRALSYGSGTDRRPAYGRDVDVRTPTADASPILSPFGWGADEAREWFWGFGTDAVPLNGLAWLPVGSGPFPLVLVVHGNHAMGEFSEPGYAYLGEQLASRGFITVSVDENFLNGSWAGDWGGTEQLARAWLLLLHVDQWRTWNADPGSPFHGLVDLDRVALIGHSRGGEAAAVAASIAARPAPPATGLAPWPIGLHIRAVVGIAPSDAQYSGGNVVLGATDYLTLHGGHDADATGWMGIRQYARTVVDPDGFKAALWTYRANHGQFSSVWGRSDHGALGGAILSLGALQDAADQQDVAKTAIGAFLEASLHDQGAYRDLFRRPMVGRAWLPADDIYLVRSKDGAYEPLLAGDGARGIEGVTVTASGFESRVARAVPLRALLPDQLTRGLELRWAAGTGPATWTVDWADGGFTDIGTGLVLSLANGSTSLDAGAAPLDPSVELTTTDGVTVSLPLARWGVLPPPLEVELVKDQLLTGLASMDVAQGAPVERVLQTYEIPFDDFAAADPRFDPGRVAALRIVIDRAVAGSLWVAEVGLVAER